VSRQPLFFFPGIKGAGRTPAVRGSIVSCAAQARRGPLPSPLWNTGPSSRDILLRQRRSRGSLLPIPEERQTTRHKAGARVRSRPGPFGEADGARHRQWLLRQFSGERAARIGIAAASHHSIIVSPRLGAYDFRIFLHELVGRSQFEIDAALTSVREEAWEPAA
jgi:hypothetical protein